jgi:hypothetical protein
MKYTLLLLTLCSMTTLSAQNELPLREIPPAPADYRAGNVLARMVEGLGYRYYWATEGLREEDLAYKPSPDARTTDETLNHILGLSATIMRNTLEMEVDRMDYEALSFAEKRKMTLENLARTSEALRGKKKKHIGKLQIVFGRGENVRTFPYWNMINGPIADAIYHTGQVVSFRRASGNPINPHVRVFTGKTQE